MVEKSAGSLQAFGPLRICRIYCTEPERDRVNSSYGHLDSERIKPEASVYVVQSDVSASKATL